MDWNYIHHCNELQDFNDKDSNLFVEMEWDEVVVAV